MVVPLEPDVPAIQPAAPVQGQAGELLVRIEAGDSDIRGYAISVDGAVRAWLPGRTGTARLSVAPGEHRVRVAHPWRHVGWIGIVPLPESGELAEQLRVQCAPQARCGIAAEPFLHRQKGLQLKLRTLDAAELEQDAVGRGMRLPDRDIPLVARAAGTT